jgi:hypothetical protein
MPGRRTRGRSWKLDVDAQNFAFFGMSDQSAFGGRFSLNLWAREAKPWAHSAYSMFLYIIPPLALARIAVLRASWTFFP